MSPRYILRFDDVCPTMDWAVWDQVEEALRKNGIKPIVAIVPDNRDPKLRVTESRGDFWDRARDWARSGWAIAVHGYQHVYSCPDSGIIGLNCRSEFAGVARDIQSVHLDAALCIFREQKITPTVWVAPGHSFDWNTVACLRERGISVISDGFYARPVRHGGCTWVPQQLWRLRRMPPGTWTACYHINGWRKKQLIAFDEDLGRFHDDITSVDDVLARPVADRGLADTIFAAAYRQLVLARRRISANS